MKTNTYRIKNLIILILMLIALVNCKNENKNSTNQEADGDEETFSSKSNNDSEERTSIKGMVEVIFDGETVKFTEFDQTISTDVTFLDNGIQFRLNSPDQKSILMNMYSPDFFNKKLPITISQQSHAIPLEDYEKVKTQSRLEAYIPSNPIDKRDQKILYEGTVTLNELSEDRLVVTFSGTGVPLADSIDNFFPFEGKIVLESYNVYDFRQK